MFELDNCGKELHLTNLSGLRSFDAKVQMVIKAPKGTMVIFEPKALKWDYPILGWTKQCEAIKAFMEEHNEMPK